MLRVPDNFTETNLGMSNLDHTIDHGFEKELRNAQVFGRHSAWDFNGKVWFENGKFHTEVWIYKSYRETMSDENLDDLMELVNNKYGYN